MIYVNAKKALEMGMTHHGRLFGVPAWVRPVGDDLDGFPKFLPLIAWCWLCDSAIELMTYFMRNDQCIEAPLRVLKPIEGES